MPSRFQFLSPLLLLTMATHAQNIQDDSGDPIPTLHIGDPAPSLRLSAWIKGEPVKKFEKGRVYVLEFWATWCKPCIAEMPHLSALARKYKDKITFLGIDILEAKSMRKVKNFVDSMGNRMDYNVAMADSNFMQTEWINASGKPALPGSFVVDAEGRLAWFGHPSQLDEVLSKIANNSWNINEALARRKLENHLEKLDEDAYYNLMYYWGERDKPDDPGKPDSALIAINDLVAKEPRLKYAPRVAYHTFIALLKTDLPKAYEYGKLALANRDKNSNVFDYIIGAILTNSTKIKLPAEIYELGAEAQQAEIDWIPYPENVNMVERYNRMAEWYFYANKKPKAIDAQQKAIEALKNKKVFSANNLAALESLLQKYKTM
jgi:thiol-disulfide isomerase/thioredoxin